MKEWITKAQVDLILNAMTQDIMQRSKGMVNGSEEFQMATGMLIALSNVAGKLEKLSASGRAVEVTRCAGCEHMQCRENGIWCTVDPVAREVHGEWFCSRGETSTAVKQLLEGIKASKRDENDWVYDLDE